MIREAKYIDNIQLRKLMKEMHEKSIYADRITVKEELFKNICVSAMNQKGNRACLFVAETDGVIEGFIVGCVDRIYGIAKELYATDLFFYTSDRAHAKSAMGLIKTFEKWAKEQKNVIEIRLGITGAIGGWERLEKVYDRLGYSRDGVMMAKEIKS